MGSLVLSFLSTGQVGEQVKSYWDTLLSSCDPADDSGARLIAGFEQMPGHLVGSVDTVHDKVRAIEATNVDMLVLTVESDPIRHRDAVRTIREFGAHIMPGLKSRHGDHQRWREQQLEHFGLPIGTSV
jgi:hypothetical protein